MVRSPRAFMKIADNAVDSPVMRWQKLQSIRSRANAASTRSPLASSPAGPPIGPARATRPPSRAMATAAFAAQPPLTTKNPVACTLPSGCGNSVTRNTSSSTMMPVHRMRRAGSAEDIAAVLDVIPNDVMRDGDRRRRGQSLGMAPIEHQGEFLAVEPPRILDLAAIDHDSVRCCLGVTADHQRHRERPRLRCEIAHAPGGDADLFKHFAAHRLLDRLAWFAK